MLTNSAEQFDNEKPQSYIISKEKNSSKNILAEKIHFSSNNSTAKKNSNDPELLLVAALKVLLGKHKSCQNIYATLRKRKQENRKSSGRIMNGDVSNFHAWGLIGKC